jgi:hypothetical protein
VAPRSRGLIIPALLASDGLDETLAAASSIDLRAFLPFRLIAAHETRVSAGTWDGDTFVVEHFLLDAPLVFTSSSLGDHVVEPPRLRLFADVVVDSPSWLDGQFRFHRHQWRDQPELSVRMERPGARTVSISSIDAGQETLLFTYQTLPWRQVH